MEKDIFKDRDRLTRFVWKLRFLPDTPALIQFVAGDEDYLELCSRIVNGATEGSPDIAHLKELCLKQKFEFQILKDKLTPVARAFGLAEDQSDYYELLGVSRDADTADIKRAFRKRVVAVHPDTSDQISASSTEFINLQAAYQFLSDPILRRQYDQNLHDVNLWKEKAYETRAVCRSNPLISHNPSPGWSTRTKIFYQLGALFLLLVIAVFIFDFLYQQNAIFDEDQLEEQERVISTETPQADEKQDTDSAPKSAEAKFLADPSAQKMFKSYDNLPNKRKEF